MKKIALLLCTALLLLSLAACGDTAAAPIPLTEEETGILEAMGSDVNVVSDADYAAVLTELQAHPGDFSGQVYQFEGVFTTSTVNGVETPFVYRTLVYNGEETVCGLPLKYLEKELLDGAWTRVTGIVGTDDFGGETQTVMEVVAVETLEKAGQSQLEWDGVGHQH